MDGRYFYIMAGITGVVLVLTFLYILFSFFFILYSVKNEKDRKGEPEATEQTDPSGGPENIDQEKLSKQRLEQLCIDLEEIGLK